MERILRVLLPLAAICMAAFFSAEGMLFYDSPVSPAMKLETTEDMEEFLQDAGEQFLKEIISGAAFSADELLKEVTGMDLDELILNKY